MTTESPLEGAPNHTVRGVYRPAPSDRRVKLPTTLQIASKLRERGLRPVIDPVLDLVRADCPDCHGAATDPQGMWRPLAVMSSRMDGKVISSCDYCGRRNV